jgi:RNA polymerase sigma-70 factor (ECF subfamily)
MPPENDTTRLVQSLRPGEEVALNDLIRYAYERMRHLSRKMLRNYPNLRGIEQTDDVLHNALIRLHLELQKGKPLESGLHFWNWTTLLIRRSLVDLARKHRGRHGQHPRPLTGQDDGEAGPLQPCPDTGDGPQSLAEWTEFHEQVEALPDKEKEVFGLRWYGGLSHEAAAAVLGISEREVKRRWATACMLLDRKLQGSPPQ